MTNAGGRSRQDHRSFWQGRVLGQLAIVMVKPEINTHLRQVGNNVLDREYHVLCFTVLQNLTVQNTLQFRSLVDIAHCVSSDNGGAQRAEPIVTLTEAPLRCLSLDISCCDVVGSCVS